MAHPSRKHRILSITTMLLNLDDILASNRRTFGTLRMDGTGDGGGSGSAGDGGSGGGNAGSGGGGDAGGSGSGAAGTGGGTGDAGFPPHTPLEQMTGEQREAYWRHHARKHEDRVKQLDNLTPDELKALRDKATKHDQLERELASDKDKAVLDAKAEAEKSASEKYAPMLVRSQLEVAAARKNVSTESLTAALEFVDTSKFLTSNGEVDTAKVTTFIDGITPATGNSNGRRGPTATGHGSGTNGSADAPTGRELFEQRHKKRTTSTNA